MGICRHGFSTAMKKSQSLLILIFLIMAKLSLACYALSTSPGTRVVWFRPHGLRTKDNEALWTAVQEHDQENNNEAKRIHGNGDTVSNESSLLRFVFVWDRPIRDGGTASDVFVVHALHALNETLNGRLEIVHCETPTSSTTSSRKDGNEMEMADAILSHVRNSNGPPREETETGSDGTVEIYYLETYDRALEDSLVRQLTKQRENDTCPVRARPYRGNHTLLDYVSYHNDNQSPANLLKKAIEEHPFASPLIPFVDFVVAQLEEMPPTTVFPAPKIPPSTVALLPGHYNQAMCLEYLLETAGKTRNTHWGKSLAQRWPATEEAAARALNDFVDAQYPSLLVTAALLQEQSTDPNVDKKQTKRTHLASCISPYLARGLVSPKQMYWAIRDKETTILQQQNQQKQQQGSNSFLRRMAWRDYAYVVSMVFPEAIRQKQPIRDGYDDPLDSKDEATPQEHRVLLDRWKRGMTGFPLVDAGMRQLTTEGFMPQQVRLAASACLVEGLNIKNGWRWGCEHFEAFLIDYDVVINTNMWMNAGGVGLDPYYIGLDYKKRPYWDADGSYVRTWCPELQYLPDKAEILPTIPGTGGTNIVDCLYTPWRAPLNVLKEADVILGKTYPHRICDEREGRRQFIQTLRSRRSAWQSSRIDPHGKDIIELKDEAGSLSCRVGVFTPKPLLL